VTPRYWVVATVSPISAAVGFQDNSRRSETARYHELCDFRTTMIYTHVPNKAGLGVQSPADFLTTSHANARCVSMYDAQEKQ
jgi:hypothetical protein